MNSPDNLFLLIQSLSKAEKRFFKLKASKYSKEDGNDYLLLYKLIEQQNAYDEDKIKIALKGNTLLKRLPSAKNYLYKMLLRSLSQLQYENNCHFQISNLLQEVDLLHFRGLYKGANKLLQKAKKIATDTQKLNSLLVINEWEISLANFEPTFEKSQQKIAILQQERAQYIEDLNVYAGIELVYEEVGEVTYSIGHARTESEKEVYAQFFKRPEVLAAEQSSSLNTLSLLYAFKDTTSYMMGFPKEDVFFYAKKRVEIFEAASAEQTLENAYFYAASAFDYIQALLTDKQLAIAQQELDKLNHYWTAHKARLAKSVNAIFFFVVSYHSSKIPMLQGRFGDVVTLAQELKPEFEERQGQADQDRALYIVPVNLGFSCFVCKEYNQALFWFRYILNDVTITIRPDVLGFVRILHLLVQYELDNKQILSYFADSTQRYLTKNNKLYEFENLFLQFIKQLAFKTSWDSEYVQLLKKQKKKLLQLEKKNSFEKQYIQQYYLVEWIDSKLLQRPFEGLILEKITTQTKSNELN